jgi:pre-mRNA-splicing factor SYF1
VYERGVALFKYPHVRDIWAAYLKQFVERWVGVDITLDIAALLS